MAKANRAISLGVSALIVIVLILIVGFGLFLNATFTTTSTSIISQTSGISSPRTTSSGSNMTTTCVINAEGNLIFTLQNSSSGKPLSSVPIQVSYLAPICPPNPHTTATLGQMMTNGSGIITVCCGVGEYYFSLTYSGLNYNVNASIGPERATCVTLDMPSGKVNITNSQTFQTVC